MFTSISSGALAAVSGGSRVFHSQTRETVQLRSDMTTLDRADRHGTVTASYRKVSTGIYVSRRSGTCFAHPDGNEVSCVGRRGQSMSFFYFGET